MIRHYSLGDVQPDTGTIVFCGKKGIKYFFSELAGNAGPGIGNLNADPAAHDLLVADPTLEPIQGLHAHSNVEHTDAAHRIPGVDAEIHHQLLQVQRVDCDRRRHLGPLGAYFYARRQHRPQHADDLLQLRNLGISLDAPQYDDEDTTLLDTLPGGPFGASEASAESGSLHARLLSEMEDLERAEFILQKRFFRPRRVEEESLIQFGTGGWRAIIGEGFTLHNVRRLAQALANEVTRRGLEKQGVVIGYDRRFLSDWAAEAAARGVHASPGTGLVDPETVAAFEQGLRDNDDNISPSYIYAYAALKMGIPFCNGAPNLTVDTPAMAMKL